LNGIFDELWAELSADRSRGSTELTLHALNTIYSELDNFNEVKNDDCKTILRNFKECRPEMILMKNAARLIFLQFQQEQSVNCLERFKEAVESVRDRIRISGRDIGTSFESLPVNPRSVVVFSRSGVVMSLLSNADPIKSVTVLESHPGNEGISVANILEEKSIAVNFAYDTEAPTHLKSSDALILGADSFDERGSIYNKVGSRLMALAAHSRPVLACFQTLKLRDSRSDASVPSVESPESLKENLRTTHELFERVAPEYLDYYVTDAGYFEDENNLLQACEAVRLARRRSAF